MSSLAAVQADGYYYGPDYKPEEREKNKRVRSGVGKIRVIRFEMPFKVICLNCEAIVAKGVRFNAEKKCIGFYFTTEILQFKMKCYYCPNYYVIETDPKKCEYLCKEGVRKKFEEFSFEANETIELLEDEEKEKRRENAMLCLELQKKNEILIKSEKKIIDEIISLNDQKSDDYFLNCEMRNQFRTNKKKLKNSRQKNFTIPLINENKRDIEISKKIKFKNKRAINLKEIIKRKTKSIL